MHSDRLAVGSLIFRSQGPNGAGFDESGQFMRYDSIRTTTTSRAVPLSLEGPLATGP